MKVQGIPKQLLESIVRVIPLWMGPMYFTGLRIALIPVVALCLFRDAYAWATLAFAVAVLADAIDGELARTRNQISELGIVLDPLADKVLIGIVALLLIPPFFGWAFVACLLLLEIAITIAAYVRDRRVGKHVGATRVGKLKMIVQSVALVTLLFAASTQSKLLMNAALIALITAIVLAVATLDSYIRYQKQ